MTYLQMINKVLLRLREDQVTTVNESEYAQLIGEFVNDAKEEVEEAWHWSMLRSTIQVTTVVGTFAYKLTGAGNRFEILQVNNDTDDYDLQKAPSYEWMNRQLLTNSQSNGDPFYYDINGNEDGDPITNVWPVPASAVTLNYNLFLPQDEFTLGTETLTVPSKPVILRATMYALEERGDAGGRTYERIHMQYDRLLGEAILRDQSIYPNETIWSAD